MPESLETQEMVLDNHEDQADTMYGDSAEGLPRWPRTRCLLFFALGHVGWASAHAPIDPQISPISADVLFVNLRGLRNLQMPSSQCESLFLRRSPCNLMMASPDYKVASDRQRFSVQWIARAGSRKTPPESLGARFDQRSRLPCHDEAQVVRLTGVHVFPFAAAVVLAVRIDTVEKVATR